MARRRDLARGRTAIPDAASGWMTALWTEASRVMAWAWLETPDELSLVVDPEQVGLVDEVLAWAVEVATGQELCCSVLETEGHLIEALTGAGFEPVDGGPFFTHHTMSLTELDDPVLEEGFTLRHVEPREAGERAACHRTAWSDFGSRVSARSYGQVMNTWPYRPGLDWVVQAPDGEMVANALGWIDDVNGVGLLEPVGCSPAFRRRGLAKAVKPRRPEIASRCGSNDRRGRPERRRRLPRARDALPEHRLRTRSSNPDISTYSYSLTSSNP